MVRIAVVARPDGGWRSEGLARTLLAHLSRFEHLLPTNPLAARKHLLPKPSAEAAKVLRSQWVAVVSVGGADSAKADLLEVQKGTWRTLSVGAPLHELPGELALALVDAMGLKATAAEREKAATPMVANAAAIEALWQGNSQSDPTEKLRYYRRAAVHDAASPTVRNLIGTALASLGNRTEALREFDRALALQPDSMAAHTNRGLMLAHLGKWDEAEEALRKAIELGTKSPTPHVALARIVDRKGAVLDAADHLGKAVELDPSRIDALMSLADINFAQHNVKGARRRVERVIALEPRHVPALNLLGLLKLAPRDYKGAEATLRQALDVEPDSVPTLANLGLALYGQRRVDEAIASLKRAIALDSTDANAHFYLGRIYLQEKRYGEAEASLERAVEFAPHMIPARQALQQARAARGTPGAGCGCLPFAQSMGLAERSGAVLWPVALLLGPHAVRLAKRRRRRRR